MGGFRAFTEMYYGDGEEVIRKWGTNRLELGNIPHQLQNYMEVANENGIINWEDSPGEHFKSEMQSRYAHVASFLEQEEIHYTDADLKKWFNPPKEKEVYEYGTNKLNINRIPRKLKAMMLDSVKNGIESWQSNPEYYEHEFDSVHRHVASNLEAYGIDYNDPELKQWISKVSHK